MLLVIINDNNEEEVDYVNVKSFAIIYLNSHYFLLNTILECWYDQEGDQRGASSKNIAANFEPKSST